MKRARGVALGVWAAALLASCAAAPSTPASGVGPGWTLAWQDDFTGPAGAPADPARWRADTGDGCARGICGWGNEERQTYTSAAENASLTGAGHLAIVARRVDRAASSCWYGPCRYTSAKLHTQGTVEARHGRVEARVRLPRGQGLWPAFWMLGSSFGATPWPACGELDVMEFRGSRPAAMSSAVHGPGYSGNTPFVHELIRPTGTFVDDFHVFGVEWDRDTIRFLADGAVHYTLTRAEVERQGRWVFDDPFFVILNLAVGGKFDGDPATDDIFPATMLVDWVRVYTRTGA